MLILLIVLLAVIGGGAYFTIQLQQANEIAEDKAVAAEKAEKIAKDATAQLQGKLDAIKAANDAKLLAEAKSKDEEAARLKEAEERKKAEQETVAVKEQSQEDLQKKNAQLQMALVEAQRNAEVAKKAELAAKDAKSALERSNAAQADRIKKLEAEKKAISTGGL